MTRDLGDGFELDDDPARIDREAVHGFLTTSYWAEGRPREVQDALVESSQRVVGLYREGRQVGFSARAGGAVCREHAREALRLSRDGLAVIEHLLSTPLADAVGAPLESRSRRDALAVITSSYEEHGGFRLRTVSA